jgi:hypothetical protein
MFLCVWKCHRGCGCFGGVVPSCGPCEKCGTVGAVVDCQVHHRAPQKKDEGVYVLVDAKNGGVVGSRHDSIAEAMADWRPGLALRCTDGTTRWTLNDVEFNEACCALAARGTTRIEQMTVAGPGAVGIVLK